MGKRRTGWRRVLTYDHEEKKQRERRVRVLQNASLYTIPPVDERVIGCLAYRKVFSRDLSSTSYRSQSGPVPISFLYPFFQTVALKETKLSVRTSCTGNVALYATTGNFIRPFKGHAQRAVQRMKIWPAILRPSAAVFDQSFSAMSCAMTSFIFLLRKGQVFDTLATWSI